MNPIALTSGGLDSTTLVYWLLDRKVVPDPLFINYGQHCAETELETLKSVLPDVLVKKVKVLDISTVYIGSRSRLISEADLWTDKVEHTDFYLPYRNLLLLTSASAYAQSHGYSEVYSAFINSNHAQEIDASARFLSELEKVFEEYGGIKIQMPFRELSKFQVAKIGIELKAPIGLTFSCQASSTIPCGACPNCVDRLDALQKLSETIS